MTSTVETVERQPEKGMVLPSGKRGRRRPNFRQCQVPREFICYIPLAGVAGRMTVWVSNHFQETINYPIFVIILN